MAKSKQPPADDLTLRDVIEHMNHKFSVLEKKMNEGFQKMDRGFAEAKRERAEILRRVDAEAAATDDSLEKVVALTERVETIEKHLALPRRK